MQPELVYRQLGPEQLAPELQEALLQLLEEELPCTPTGEGEEQEEELHAMLVNVLLEGAAEEQEALQGAM